MLVLTRKVGEELVIDGDIRITITEIQNGRVRVGVTAPKNVHILRGELEPATDGADLGRILAARAKCVEAPPMIMKAR